MYNKIGSCIINLKRLFQIRGENRQMLKNNRQRKSSLIWQLEVFLH